MADLGMTLDLSAFDSEEESTAEGGGPPAHPAPVESQPHTIDGVGSGLMREQFGTPLVGVEGVSTSPLVGSAAHAGVEQPLERPVRTLLQTISGGIWQHVAPLPAAVSARLSQFAERLQTVAAFGATRLQQSLERARAHQQRLPRMAVAPGTGCLQASD